MNTHMILERLGNAICFLGDFAKSTEWDRVKATFRLKIHHNMLFFHFDHLRNAGISLLSMTGARMRIKPRQKNVLLCKQDESGSAPPEPNQVFISL